MDPQAPRPTLNAQDSASTGTPQTGTVISDDSQTTDLSPTQQPTSIYSQQPVISPQLQPESSKRKKTIIIASAALLVLLAALGMYFVLNNKKPAPQHTAYSSSAAAPQDTSTYAKLSTNNYSSDGLVFSLQYPSFLQPKTNVSPSVPVAYYAADKSLAISVLNLKTSDALSKLNLTPTQMLTQIKDGSGSYIDYLNNLKPGLFKTAYPYACNSYLIDAIGQRNLLCLGNSNGYNVAQVIGVTNNNQYTLELYMQPSVWTAHQSTWQTIEKNFTYR